MLRTIISTLQMKKLRPRNVNYLSKVRSNTRQRQDMNRGIWLQRLGFPKHKFHCLSDSLKIFLKYLFINYYGESMNCLILFNYLDNHAVFGDHYADNEFSLYNSIKAEKKI